MKTIIATRSANETLYNMASSFWPAHIERRRMTGFDHWRDALHYLHEIQNLEADVVVNCDEDCAIFDWSAVLRIIDRMQATGSSYAGMPDTLENHAGRNNGAFVHNPFFNVFFPRKVQDALRMTPWYAHAVTVNSNPAGCPHHEVFNNFFAALHEQLRPLDLGGRMHADGTSTELLGVNGQPFALHSWYSRSYASDPDQFARINALFEEARLRAAHAPQ